MGSRQLLQQSLVETVVLIQDVAAHLIMLAVAIRLHLQRPLPFPVQNGILNKHIAL